ALRDVHVRGHGRRREQGPGAAPRRLLLLTPEANPMNFLDGGFPAATVAVAALIRDHGTALPALTYDTLAAYTPSPVDRLVTQCEALYAAADSLPDAGLLLCAQLARIAQDGAFHHLGQSDRAGKVIAAMRRRLGELDEAA